MTQQPGYLFEDRAADHERLVAQGTILDPHTRRFLGAAGLTRGMRVLDLGSGAGNTAMIAADLVGSEGAVVGIEHDATAVDYARRRIAAAGVPNIEVRLGDVQSLDGVEDGFDAVIGRLILMYLADPVDALRQAAARTRPGGLICMQEVDLTYPWSHPQTPLWQQITRWFLDTLAKAGIEPRMGLSLFAGFRAAGLPDPQLVLDAVVEGGPEARTWLWANVVGGVVPLMERFGVASSGEVDSATLADRLLAELNTADGFMLGPPTIGAWTTRPTH
jgi:SAM-dependent methyltransferase